MASNGELRVGTSGYQYGHWRGRLYPRASPKTRWFDLYAEHFDTVEINNTFYNLPSAKTFDTWRVQAPDGFCYALKYSRYGSHLKHLKDPEQHLDRFLERAERLGAYLGPILVQLPPRWTVDVARLSTFLAALATEKTPVLPGSWEFNTRGLLYVPVTGEWANLRYPHGLTGGSRPFPAPSNFAPALSYAVSRSSQAALTPPLISSQASAEAFYPATASPTVCVNVQ